MVGACYRCEVCPSFVMCRECFRVTPHATPRHTFVVFAKPGEAPISVGPSCVSRRQRLTAFNIDLFNKLWKNEGNKEGETGAVLEIEGMIGICSIYCM